MTAENVRDQDVDFSLATVFAGLVRRVRRLPWWVKLGSVAMLLGFVRAVISGVGAADEAWFLYVSHRLNLGQTLYRDVWVPVFPLSVWLADIFTRVFGEHVFVLKLADTLCFTGTVIACASVVRRLTPRKGYTVLLLAVMLGWTGPGVIGPGSLYTALAYALTAGVLALALAWIDSGTDLGTRDLRILLGAAAMAGLAFCSKQPMGVFAFGALLMTLLVAGGRRDLRRATRYAFMMTGVFVGVLVLAAVPAALSGGLPALLRDTLSFTGSASYVRAADYPYIVGLGLFVQQLIDPIHASLSVLSSYAAYVLPLAAAPLFAWALTVEQDVRRWAIGFFCLAALAGTYPRTDEPHYMAAVPFLIVLVIVSWETLRPQMTDAVRAVVLAATVVFVCVRLASVVAVPFAGGDAGLVVSNLPYFHGALLRAQDAKAADEAVALLRAAPQKNIFILSLRGGLLYLATGREDPTAYDYPDLYGFGGFEQDDVVNAVEHGRVEAIWFDEGVGNYPGWKESRIWAYISNAMEPTGTVTPWGQLYVPTRPQTP